MSNKLDSMNRAKKNRVESAETPAQDFETLAANERQKRAEQCANEINALLEKYRCEFSPVTVITRNEIRTQVQIVSK